MARAKGLKDHTTKCMMTEALPWVRKNNIKHLTKSRTLKVIGVFFVKVYNQHKCKCREFTTSH